MEIKSLRDVEWMEDKNCSGVNPNIFYPSAEKDTVLIEHAKKICRECIVINDCLEYAMVNRQEYGIWGGKTENERHKLGRRIRSGQISVESITRRING